MINMSYQQFCIKRKIELTPFQIRLSTQLIEAISRLSDSDFNNMTMLGTGVTTTFQLVESYFKYDEHLKKDN